MNASLADVVSFLDNELRTREIEDYPAAMNGLQLANSGVVTHVAAAVDFSAIVVRAAVARGANLLVLHHGMFWADAIPIVGPRYDRLSLLMRNDIAVYGSHLPLDLHATYGNNVLLAQELGLVPSGGFASSRGIAIGVSGHADVLTADLVARARTFSERHSRHLIVTPFDPQRRTYRWGICSGAGASTESLREAFELGLDTILVGEGPHHTAVQAVDLGITIIYAGHYATETLGVRAITTAISKRFNITSSFIEAPTGL
jgi:dinuclear metal center YbgI/SA1388 family protein